MGKFCKIAVLACAFYCGVALAQAFLNDKKDDTTDFDDDYTWDEEDDFDDDDVAESETDV
jgi:hypothetical protein